MGRAGPARWCGRGWPRWLGLLGVGLLLVACGPSVVVWGSGRVSSETRPVRGFDAVVLRGGGELIVRQTGSESLSIDAEESILPHIQAQVRHGRLTIGPADGADLRASQPVRYRLTVARLGRLSVPDPATVVVDGLDGPSLEVDLGPGARVVASGEAARQEFRLLGDARIDARNLRGRVARVVGSGPVEAAVAVAERVDLSIDGSATLLYRDDPVVSGARAGTIVRRDQPDVGQLAFGR